LEKVPYEKIKAGQKLTPGEWAELMRLPMSERRRILAEQADKIASYYEEDTEWRELQEGDVIEL